MKIKQLAYLLTLAAPLTANADSLSISAGGGSWDESVSGNFQKTIDPVAVDVEDNLFWDSESQGYAFITLEHFVPIVPNVRLMYTKIDHDGSGITDFKFNNQTFKGLVTNDIEIETTDLILYYEVLDNVVSLDLGLNIRSLKADYTITGDDGAGGINTTTDSIDEIVPMLYAAIGASPWPELLISGELSYVAFDGSSVSDFTAKIAYTTNFLLGFEAGYRKQNFEFDDVSDTDADLDFDGIFAGAYLKF